MSVFDHPEFDQHELVHQAFDPATGLATIIAIHSTALGPAAGGCRRWQYVSSADALTDALRLSRGMTYKNAIAGLPFGGGKAVILASKDQPKTPAMFTAFGRIVDSLGGRYITAEDVGMTVDDMHHVAAQTRYVSGLPQQANIAGGDPSPWTALGVSLGIAAAVKTRLGHDSLKGLRIAVQGVGNVGFNLCKLLHEQGAVLTVADVNAANLARAADALPVTTVSTDDILYADVDVVAPCALGKVFTAQSIERVRAPIIAGGANNQLDTEADGALLRDRDILYAPDFVINGGGIICVSHEYKGGSTPEQLRADVEKIPHRLKSIFNAARSQGRSTNDVANEMARALVAAGAKNTHEEALSA
ncbi:MAG: Glu/Leu/Phe/Val dehydrogenase [Gammaproteobacteria bacterium]